MSNHDAEAADPNDLTSGTVLEEHQHTHVLPWQLLVAVWVALMGFTGLTVFQATLDLGGFDLQIAMFIATCKALLVALIFMHLRWDRPFNGLVFLSSLVFAGLFVAISMLDTTSNQEQISSRQIDQPLDLRPDYESHLHHGHGDEGDHGEGDHADDHDDHGEGDHADDDHGDHGDDHGDGEHAEGDDHGSDH